MTFTVGQLQHIHKQAAWHEALDLIDYARNRADGYLSTLLAVHMLDASDDDLVEMGLPPIEERHR